MRILLSAYACEPGRGSEPGVGWNWATEISKRGHDVWVLTRKNNRHLIDQADYDRDKISFFYYDLPGFFIKLKKFMGVNLYYIFWQLGVAIAARKLSKQTKFDLVHHITFGVFRNISYLPFVIKAPFAFGPVGGGEQAPFRLRTSFGLTGWIKDLFRDIVNIMTYYNPIYRLFLSKTHFIICKTEHTRRFIPAIYQKKTCVNLEIGIHTISTPPPREKQTPCLLFVGRFIYWKGAHIAIKVLAELQKNMPDLKMIMIGKGDYFKRLKKLEADLAAKNIEWIDWIDQNQLNSYYRRCDVMLFPSFHDSSGNVVLEALSNGLPVVCLDFTGPATIVGHTMSTVIATFQYSERQLVKIIADRVAEILTDSVELEKLGQAALQRATQFMWFDTVNKSYEHIEKSIFIKNRNLH